MADIYCEKSFQTCSKGKQFNQQFRKGGCIISGPSDLFILSFFNLLIISSISKDVLQMQHHSFCYLVQGRLLVICCKICTKYTWKEIA